jgi:ATP-dependent exoDNAse (exonuclease V) beta subunit
MRPEFVKEKDKIYISPSRIKTYKDCPYKFKLKYILQTPPSDVIPIHVFAPGQTVHSLAENYCFIKKGEEERIIEEDVKKQMKVNKLDDMFFNSIKKQYMSVRKFINPYLEDEDSGKCIIAKEVQIKQPWFSNYVFYGYIDLRIKYNDKIVIVDYKTSKEEGDHDLQLAVYAYCTYKSFNLPLDKIESIVYYTKKDFAVKKTYSDSELKKEFLKIVDVLERSKKDKKFLKSVNEYCENCEYFTNCNPYKRKEILFLDEEND